MLSPNCARVCFTCVRACLCVVLPFDTYTGRLLNMCKTKVGTADLSIFIQQLAGHVYRVRHQMVPVHEPVNQTDKSPSGQLELVFIQGPAVLQEIKLELFVV